MSGARGGDGDFSRGAFGPGRRLWGGAGLPEPGGRREGARRGAERRAAPGHAWACAPWSSAGPPRLVLMRGCRNLSWRPRPTPVPELGRPRLPVCEMELVFPTRAGVVIS